MAARSYCFKCSTLNVQLGFKYPTTTHRCSAYPKRLIFKVRTGSIIQSSKLSFQVWVFALYLFSTGIKGTSSMKLHRDFSITYKTVWYLAPLVGKVHRTV